MLCSFFEALQTHLLSCGLRMCPKPAKHASFWCVCRTCWIHNFVNSVSFHPLDCTLTTTPDGILNFLSALFPLNITIGGNIFPAAVHAKMTVKRRFSAPVYLIWTSLHPFLLTADDAGMPIYTGVSSMLMMSGLGKLCLLEDLNIGDISSFASSSGGNFCWMLVFGPKSQKKNNMLTHTITLYACYYN